VEERKKEREGVGVVLKNEEESGRVLVTEGKFFHRGQVGQA